MPKTRLLLMFAALLPIAASAQPQSVYLEDLTWPEVREAIRQGKTTAIYYAGGTEQNGPHMALGKHNVVAHYVSGRIATELGNALAYPVLPFAPSGDPEGKTGHMGFPGTVSLSDATFGAVAREVARSAISSGFRNVVLMGDHGGGQEALRKAAEELDREWSPRGARVFYVPDPYFRTEQEVRDYLRQRGLKAGAHADIHDTSELMFLDSEHRWVRRDKLAPGDGTNGVDGDPRKSSAELGKRFLDFKIASAVARIRQLVADRR